MNAAVVGNSGVGKSLLINKLRRAKPGTAHWAGVGVSETTMEPTMYAFPGRSSVRLWDLPGAGTASFPLETYIESMGLCYFDSVLIVSAGRFTTTEIQLREELAAHGVPFFMVRTKVDMDVWNNRLDNGASEEATLQHIRDDLRRRGVERAYLVSARDPDRYDLRSLLGDAFPGLQRHLDALDFMFCPAPAAGWGEAWVLPRVLSPVLARIQGHWLEAGTRTLWIVDGSEAHGTRCDGQAAVVRLSDSEGKVWCYQDWFVDLEAALHAEASCELRWTPSSMRLEPIIWRWNG